MQLSDWCHLRLPRRLGTESYSALPDAAVRVRPPHGNPNFSCFHVLANCFSRLRLISHSKGFHASPSLFPFSLSLFSLFTVDVFMFHGFCFSRFAQLQAVWCFHVSHFCFSFITISFFIQHGFSFHVSRLMFSLNRWISLKMWNKWVDFPSNVKVTPNVKSNWRVSLKSATVQWDGFHRRAGVRSVVKFLMQVISEGFSFEGDVVVWRWC